VLLPHRLGLDRSMAAEVDLFVSVFALTGVLGALLRLSRVVTDPGLALWWLVAALGSGIGANVTLAYAGSDGALRILADMFFVTGFAALGLFGLDPAAPRLARSGGAPEGAGASAADRLSIGRLIFLGLAVAVTPVVIGLREVGGGNVGGLLLAVQGALVAALVMTRIGLLARQRAAAEQALNYQATHDPLTRLPNRREFVARLRKTLAQGNQSLLLFCDLDDFKSINDQFGHDVGDQFLIEVADRLRTCISRPHVVSRFGGDEFVILLVNATPADGRAAQSCIVSALSRPSAQSGAPMQVSVGISAASDSRDPEDLIRMADRAMYRVKAGHSRSTPEAPRYAYDSGRG
jgi:diguanylate cyclase (GGDEF)-like protein